MARLKPPPLLPLQQGRRLLDAVGWAAILPQMLASLGAVFALAGVGEVVGDLIGTTIPEGSLLGATLAFGLGMALFTMVMGNAFAAFPVMLAAVGRSEEHTSELQSLMRISYAVFCLKKKIQIRRQ